MHIVLSSYGASLRKEHDLFKVTTSKGSQLLHPRDVESISVAKGASISSDAVLLAIQHEIDVLFVDALGRPSGRVWSVKYGSISTIRKAQLEFLYSPAAVEWVKELAVTKLNNQVALLLAFQDSVSEEESGIVRKAINAIEDHKRKVRSLAGETVSDIAPTLRGWEGAASRRYFEALNTFLPTHWRFERRSAHPARDPFNAMLNYGYGILYGKVEGALIRAGLDPYVGIFHRDDFNRPALVFDVIERFRMWIDYVVLRLAMSDALPRECFSESEEGAVRLEGLGKRILIQSVNDYLSEVIPYEGLERSRETHLRLYAQRLASRFLEVAGQNPAGWQEEE